MWNDCPICNRPLQCICNNIRCDTGHYYIIRFAYDVYEERCNIEQYSLNRGIGITHTAKYTVVWKNSFPRGLLFRTSYILPFNRINSKEKIERLLLLA